MAGPAVAVRCEGVLLSPSWTATKWVKDFRIKRHEKALESALRSGDRAVEDWVEQLFILKYGKRIPLRDYLELSKDKRAQNLLFRMWQERTVVEGFQSYGRMLGYRDQLLLRQQVKIAVKKAMSLGLKVLSLPFIEIRDAKVTADQLTTWVLEGTGKHEKEMTAYLTKQSRIDGYNNVKYIMTKVILLTMVYFIIANWDENQKEMQKQVREKMAEKAVENIESQIPNIDKTVFEYIQKSFVKLMTSYRETYHEEPTVEEIREFVILAYKDYGINIFPTKEKK
jgi:hypothetical protein